MHRRVTLSLVSALVLAACGGAAEPPRRADLDRPARVRDRPQAVRRDRRDRRRVARLARPVRFDGTYTVRFEQYAPEDPNLDFTGATSFAAALDREAEITAGDSIALFEAPRRPADSAGAHRRDASSST